MATLDIFNDNAFQVTELSDTITDIPEVPTQIGDKGIFQEKGIRTTVFMIERQGSALKLIPVAERGGVREPVALGPRKVFPLKLFHIPATWSVMADEVQGVRAFGSETEVKQVSDLVREKLEAVRGGMDLTHEYQRVGAIKGLIKDADGSSLLDLYDAFGMTQTTLYWDLANASADPKDKGIALKAAMKGKLGGRSFSGIRLICSPGFFSLFIKNANIKKAWELWQAGQFARDDQTEADFIFLRNITLEIYDGEIGGTDLIEDGFAYAYPEGVPGLFQSRYAPADYMETVNTVGKPFYAKQERMQFDKGVVGEAQSNPLHFCSLPETVFKISAAAAP